MATHSPVSQVDHTALKVNQTAIILFNILAFVFDQPWLVAFVAAVMLVGTLFPRAGLFKLFYSHVLKPAGLLKPHLVPDEPQPHLFAQGLGGIFLLLATIAFLVKAPLVGWILTGIVVALAAINLFFGFCLGCFIFYQLARRGIRLQLPQWS
ncbi:MAG: DUF4395 domain-containing protein [Anaerolineae bacterium]|nr:DUF4395 domain-containing protein [Caldilineales bacterium]MCX7852162.1 DUF4395 domain-containing protein [Caldilineales bacterium]MDW8269607.1 DUF4395 domain-containing protein [Anaerolineae bacterium]